MRYARGITTAVTATVVLALAGTSLANAAPTSGDSAPMPCTALGVFGVQGTNQSAPDADPTIDSGFLGMSVMVPLLQSAAGEVSRMLVPYAADFGWRGATYEQSMTEGVDKTSQAIADYANRCPSSMIAVTGYSQGAQIADTVIRNIGSGKGPITADKLAAAALFSSPNRPQGAGTFPGGSSGQSSPTPPKGVATSALSDLTVTTPTPADGGGIAPNYAASPGYGSVAGRVASFCTDGDLACATPQDATLARTVTNIAGQLHLEQQDPQKTLVDLAGALGGATIRTAADVVNDDINFSNGRFTVQSSGKTILGRLSTNSDPRSATPDADADVIRAVIKTGVMGLQAGIAVAKKVLTLDTIGTLATVGMANPPAALGILAAKVGDAAMSLFPPSTGTQIQKYIYNEVQRGISDNKDLLKMATQVKYWDTARNHGTYDSIPVGGQGQTPAKFTVEWFSTLAKELSSGSTSAGASTTKTASPTTRPSGTPSAAPSSSTPLTSSVSATTSAVSPEIVGPGGAFAPAQIPTPTQAPAAAPPAQ